MGLKWLKDAANVFLAPWKLARALEDYQSAQIALLHGMLEVSRSQAEANTRMIQFLQDMHDSAMVDGDPEGRNGLSDEDEYTMAMQRAELAPKRNES